MNSAAVNNENLSLMVDLVFGGFALVLTLIVEIFVARRMGYRSKTDWRAIVSVNFVTNPVLGLITIYLLPISMAGGVRLTLDSIGFTYEHALLEIAVVLVEWGLLTWALNRPPWKMLKLSLVMNAASLAAAFVLTPWAFR
jgi:hypothetical protein